VKRLQFINSPGLYLEFGDNSLRVLDGEDGLELSLERQENGRLTPECAERLTLSLRVFLKKHNWRPRLRAFCGLGARGIALRRLSLPSSSKEALDRLLPFQIEREFPIHPDELAWGYAPLSPEQVQGNGAPAIQELLVAAVKKEVLQEYAEFLCGCGLTPVFTLSALARSSLCAQPRGSYAMLDIGRSHSEMISFDNGAPSSIRILPWGGEDLTRAIEKGLGLSHIDAEKLKTRLDDEPLADSEIGQQARTAVDTELNSLARSIRPNCVGQKLYLTGSSARLKDLPPRLAKAIGGSVTCEYLGFIPGEGRSAAILGLKRLCENNVASTLPLLEIKLTYEPEKRARPAQWKWAALAGLLIFVSLFLVYAEAFLQKPRLSVRVSEIKAFRQNLPNIDRELSFLQYLKTNQPPYLEPLFGIANAAAPGTRIESLTMNRRGDLSLRATMKDSQQVVDLRSKLIDSGLFSTVVVEEQTPTPDRQKIVVRLSGQWKPNPEASRPTPANKVPPTSAPTKIAAPVKMTNDSITNP